MVEREKKLITNTVINDASSPPQDADGQEKGPREAADERVHGVRAGGTEIDLKVQFESAEFGD